MAKLNFLNGEILQPIMATFIPKQLLTNSLPWGGTFKMAVSNTLRYAWCRYHAYADMYSNVDTNSCAALS